MGLANACSNMALLLQNQGYENEALLAFNKACTLGESLSCNNIALFYEKKKMDKWPQVFIKDLVI